MPFNAKLAADASVKARRQSPYLQAVELQTFMLKDCRATETTPAQRAQLARAWCDLEDRKRILKNRPLPGSLRPERPAPKRKAVQVAPVEAKAEQTIPTSQEASG